MYGKLICEIHICAGLDREEKLINLGSRNFFMCGGGVTATATATATATCCKEAEKGATKNGWLKFMDFLF